MRTVRIEKITLNIGAGKDQARLEKGIVLLKNITGIDPIKTVARKRIPEWGLRPGLPIGCKLTLRKDKAKQLLIRLLEAKERTLNESGFDAEGNLSFGIPEYIDIEGVKYDPKIGIMGLQVCVTFQRPGYRVKIRKVKKGKISKKHKVTKEEAIDFLKKGFNVNIGGE